MGTRRMKRRPEPVYRAVRTIATYTLPRTIAFYGACPQCGRRALRYEAPPSPERCEGWRCTNSKCRATVNKHGDVSIPTGEKR